MKKDNNGTARELEAITAEAEAAIEKVKAEASAISSAALPDTLSPEDRFEALYWVAELRRLDALIEARQEKAKRLEAERIATLAEVRELEATLQRAKREAMAAEERRRAAYQIGEGDSWDGRTGQIHRAQRTNGSKN